MKDIIVESKAIGTNRSPFIIAEMSGNHNQSLERALKIVDVAADCGVDAIKIQTYTADTITINNGFTIGDQNSLWKGKSLYQLYQEAHTPWNWHEAIFKKAKERGIICFSTPFDETAVDLLENLNMSIYKIASFENTHIPLIRYIAKKKKPIIMSTGIISISDLDNSVTEIKNAGCEDLILLKCTSTYPASPENSNLLTIPNIADTFNCIVGLSDHTMGIGVSVASVALGARVIEKHFTLSRAEGGVDSAFSLEPHEMKNLVSECKNAYLAMGKISYQLSVGEIESLKFKRSIYISKDIKQGAPITFENTKIVRPAFGLEPKYYDLVINKSVKTDLKAGEPLKWEHVL